MELESLRGRAGKLELGNWRVELGLELEVENWSCKAGAGELTMESWSCNWRDGDGKLELELDSWCWRVGAGEF